MKKKVFAVIALFMCVFLFAGCADKGIQGKWELYEEIESDGNKIDRKELDENGVNEIYVIEGDVVHYSCRYEFKIGEKVTFASAEVSGNKLIYYVGEAPDMTKMVFRRSK